ncbi:MAG: UDP-N-acetylglucosamine 2-epimerase (non-hydrolyzing) [Flavobacteriales bacterium]|nr:UDP-N-acetylglucosamine 2-epimerase (non-hydrolyzing) [Flavobacteriales bacterium]
MKKVLIVIGTRPNFIKVTQFKRVAEAYSNLEVKIVHTGQHYDDEMANIFFDQFQLRPDYFLKIGAGSPNTQMANIMLGLEELIENTFRPDIMLVPGDVNSTLAAALTANKLGIKLGHIESGLRSFDRTMPEEINRILTDEITDFYFVTEESGLKHLDKEQKKGKTFFVGNTMIDTMVTFNKQIDTSSIMGDLKLDQGKFVLMTMQRPATLDNVGELVKLIELVEDLTKKYKVFFPVHPRTNNKLKELGLLDRCIKNENLVISGPIGYFEFQQLVKNCKFIVTDSGGIQEESTYRQVPCITLRPNTERPSTVDIGTNTLLPFNMDRVQEVIKMIENGSYKKGSIPELWDGKATERIIEAILTVL